jgi:hypothetical protein
MNDERTQSHRRLLNEVLRDDLDTRKAALVTFRRARFLRRAGRAGLVIVGGAAIAGALLFQQREVNPTRQVIAGNETRTDLPQVPGTTNQREFPKLTDEQLIASFPPNSCFLAEVDGRQVLVFTDPQVEAQVRGPQASRNKGL